MANFLDEAGYPFHRPEARELRDLLAKTVRRSRAIEQVLDEAGAPVHKVDMDGSAEFVWNDALKLGSLQGWLQPVLVTVKKHYPEISPRITELERLGARAPLSAEVALEGPPPRWADPADERTLEKQLSEKTTLLDIVFLRRGLEVAKSVVRLEVHVGGYVQRGTGFRVGPRHILTNDHVVDHLGQTPSLLVLHRDYEVQLNGSISSAEAIEVNQPQILLRERQTTPVQDWAVIELPHALPDAMPIIDVHATPTPTLDGRAYIIQHPGGEPKKVGLNRNLIRYVDDDIVQYITDTEAGSSGAPVFNERWELIALHYRYIPHTEEPTFGFRNQGMRIEPIARALAGQTSLRPTRPSGDASR